MRFLIGPGHQEYIWKPWFSLSLHWRVPDEEGAYYWFSIYGLPYSKKYDGPFWGFAISPPWKRKTTPGCWLKIVLFYYHLRFYTSRKYSLYRTRRCDS